MLNYEVTTQDDGIEKNLCQPMEKLNPQPMSKDLTEVFFKLMLAKDDALDLKEMRKENWLFEAVEKRIEHCLTFTADNRSMFFVTCVSGSIGKCIMYLYYMQYIAKKENIKHIDFNVFGEKFFPMGFFSDDDLKKMWDSQKVNCYVDGKRKGGSDNLLDYGAAMKSLIF